MTNLKELAARLRAAIDYTTGPYGKYRYCIVGEVEAVARELEDAARVEEMKQVAL